jgi:hypothetical protein
MYGSSYVFRHYISILSQRLVPSERRSIEKQSIEYCAWAQFSISQKALGTLPEDGNVMPKHVGATIHN